MFPESLEVIGSVREGYRHSAKQGMDMWPNGPSRPLRHDECLFRTSYLKQVFDELTPPERDYRHHLTWGDDNGRSHVRSALLGPSLTVPFVDGRLTLGTWQQVIFVDFDTRPRQRRLVVPIMGE